MITIVEPKQHIDRLWGQQRVKEGATYRLMRYLLQVEHDGKTLLHNVVTGQLVVLEENEAALMGRLPMQYTSDMAQMVARHYLVPEDYDEHQQVVNLRHILWRIADANKPKEVNSYLILPTTACNARCWYCFEKGIKAQTMTKETADEVVNFIERNCGGQMVRLWWFGGEPTLAADRIDQICQGLRDRGIGYFSDITTNGYLMDEDLIKRAKELWNINQVSISLDGTEENFNRTKAFPNVKDNPYQRVMRNVELMLKDGIKVALRMNYDQDNYTDFAKLLEEAKSRFPADAPFIVYPHQVNKDYPTPEERKQAEEWFNEKNVELTDMACESGLYRRKEQEMPSLAYEMCGAASGLWYTITPDGSLVSCGEQLGESQIKGNIREGITNQRLDQSWKQFADYNKCRYCELYPRCTQVVGCRPKDQCTMKQESLIQFIRLARSSYASA